ISVALQYGVPIESMVNKFTHQRFEPAGMTHNPDIPFAKSLVDYIFRWMGMQFIPGYRAANAPRRNIPADAPIEGTRGNTDRNPQPGPSDSAPGDRKETEDRPARMSVPEAGATAEKGNGHGHGNGGNGHGKKDAKDVGLDVLNQPVGTKPAGSALAAAMRELQADAPACDVCGTITVRSGTCYKCLNCGHSMGCS
ncbi:MAG: hypothetical protein IT442_02730, partial [Phycisphaeraceae bacterium]|nr:hypothetical protein [Phycisphaeraceae bacterium]